MIYITNHKTFEQFTGQSKDGGALKMGDLMLEKLLFDACESFIKNIDRYNWSLIYESDFRCAIYAELIRSMDQKKIDEYLIFTEHKYGDFQADIAIGPNHEIAIEIKFSFTYFSLKYSDFINAKEQLLGYLDNGAKKAYLLCLDHQIPPEREPLSKTIDIKEIGLSGEWREINGKQVAGDTFLIATLKSN